MAEDGYKRLISYQISQVAFDLGWEFVPLYYRLYEDARQRDQIKQALRSLKQNIVEGSSERSLSSKLKLYDVAKSSGNEAKEDFCDILRRERLTLWSRYDYRLRKLRLIFESYPPDSSHLSYPSVISILQVLGILLGKDGLGEKEGIDAICNYEIDLLTRCGFLLDRQMNAVEEKHRTEGGYNEKLLRRRIEYRRK